MTRVEMADEALFLLLHNEMVAGLHRAAEQGEAVSAGPEPRWGGVAARGPGRALRGAERCCCVLQENGRCITKLENMGFRVGQGLIER